MLLQMAIFNSFSWLSNIHEPQMLGPWIKVNWTWSSRSKNEVAKSWTWFNNWTTTIFYDVCVYLHVCGRWHPTPVFCLENPMDGGAWWAAVHGVTKSWTRLSDFPFTFHFHELEREMVAHSSVLAWKIPGTGEPGGLPCLGSHRVGHDWSDLAAAAYPTYS